MAGAVLQHRFQVIIPAWVLTVPPCANHEKFLSLRNVKYYPNFATRGDGCQVESCWIWFFRRNKQTVYFSFPVTWYLITSCPLEISKLVVPVQAEPPGVYIMLLAVETVYVVLILASFVVSERKVCQRGAVSFVFGIQCSAPLNSISRARTRLSVDGSAVLNSTQRKDLADVLYSCNYCRNRGPPRTSGPGLFEMVHHPIASCTDTTTWTILLEFESPCVCSRVVPYFVSKRKGVRTWCCFRSFRHRVVIQPFSLIQRASPRLSFDG